MAQFAAAATLTASVDGGAMIVVMAADSTRTSETAELISAVAIEKTGSIETLTVRLAPAADATLTLTLEGVGGVSVTEQVALIAVSRVAASFGSHGGH